MKITKKLIIGASVTFISASALIATTLLIHEKFASLKQSYLYTTYAKMHSDANDLAQALNVDLSNINEDYDASWAVLNNNEASVADKLRLIHHNQQAYTNALVDAVINQINNNQFDKDNTERLMLFLGSQTNFLQEKDLRQQFLANDLVDIDLLTPLFTDGDATRKTQLLNNYRNVLQISLDHQNQALLQVLNNNVVNLHSLTSQTKSLGSYAITNQAVNLINEINALAMNKDYRLNEFQILMHKLDLNVSDLDKKQDVNYTNDFNALALKTKNVLLNKINIVFNQLYSVLEQKNSDQIDHKQLVSLKNDFQASKDLNAATYYLNQLKELDQSATDEVALMNTSKEYNRLSAFYHDNFVVQLNQTTTAEQLSNLNTQFDEFVKSLNENTLSSVDLVAHFSELLQYTSDRIVYLKKPLNTFKNQLGVQRLLNNLYIDRSILLDQKFKYENELNGLRFADERIGLFKTLLDQLVAKDLITQYQVISINQKLEQQINEYTDYRLFIDEINSDIQGFVDLLNTQSELVVLKEQLNNLHNLYNDADVVFNKYYYKPVLDQTSSLLFSLDQDLISFKINPQLANANLKDKWENTRYLLKNQLQHIYNKVNEELNNINPNLINKQDFVNQLQVLNNTSETMLTEFNPVTSVVLWNQINAYTDLLKTYELVAVYTKNSAIFTNNSEYIRRLFNENNDPNYVYSPSEQIQIDSLDQGVNDFANITSLINDVLDKKTSIKNVNALINQINDHTDNSIKLRANAQAIKDLTHTVNEADALVDAISKSSTKLQTKLKPYLDQIQALKNEINEALTNPDTDIATINALNKRLSDLVLETNDQRKDGEMLGLMNKIGEDLIKTYPDANLNSVNAPSNTPGVVALIKRLNDLKKRVNQNDLTDEQKAALLKEAKNLSAIIPLTAKIEKLQQDFANKAQEYSGDPNHKSRTVAAINNIDPVNDKVRILFNVLGNDKNIPPLKDFYDLINNPDASNPTELGLEQQLDNLDLAFNRDRIQTYNDYLQANVFNANDATLTPLQVAFNERVKNYVNDYANTNIASDNLVTVKNAADTLNADKELQEKLKAAIILYDKLVETSPLDAAKLNEVINNNMFNAFKGVKQQVNELDKAMQVATSKAALRKVWNELDGVLTPDEKNWKIYNNPNNNLNAMINQHASDLDNLYLAYTEANEGITPRDLKNALNNLTEYVANKKQEKQALLDQYNNNYNDIKNNVIGGVVEKNDNVVVGGLDTLLEQIDAANSPEHPSFKNYNDQKTEFENAYLNKNTTNSADLKAFKQKLIHSFQQDLLLKKVKDYETKYANLKTQHPNGDYNNLDEQVQKFVDYINEFTNDPNHTVAQLQAMHARIESFYALNEIQAGGLVQLKEWSKSQEFATQLETKLAEDNLTYEQLSPEIKQSILELTKIKDAVENTGNKDNTTQTHLEQLNALINKLTNQDKNPNSDIVEIKAALTDAAQIIEDNYQQASKELNQALNNASIGLDTQRYAVNAVNTAKTSLSNAINGIDEIAGLRLANKVAISVDLLTYVENQTNDPNNVIDPELYNLVKKAVQPLEELNESANATLNNLKTVNTQINALVTNKELLVALAKKVRIGQDFVTSIKQQNSSLSIVLENYITNLENEVNNIHTNVYGKTLFNNSVDNTTDLITNAQTRLNNAITVLSQAQATNTIVNEAKTFVQNISFNGTNGIDNQQAYTTRLINWLDNNIATVVDDKQVLATLALNYVKKLAELSEKNKEWTQLTSTYTGYNADINSLVSVMGSVLPDNDNNLLTPKPANTIGNPSIVNGLNIAISTLTNGLNKQVGLNNARLALNSKIDNYLTNNNFFLEIKANYVNLTASIEQRINNIRSTNNNTLSLNVVNAENTKLDFMISLSAKFADLASQINAAQTFVDQTSPINTEMGQRINEFANTTIAHAAALYTDQETDLDTFNTKIDDAIKELAFQQAKLNLFNQEAQVKYQLNNNDTLELAEKQVLINRLANFKTLIDNVDQNATDATEQFVTLYNRYLKQTLSSYNNATDDNDSIVLILENAVHLRKMINLAQDVYNFKVTNELNAVIDGKFLPTNDQAVISAYNELQMKINQAIAINQTDTNRNEHLIREYYQIILPNAIKKVYDAKMKSYQKLIAAGDKLVHEIEKTDGINSLLRTANATNPTLPVETIKQELNKAKASLEAYNTYNTAWFANPLYIFDADSVTKTDSQTWNQVQDSVLNNVQNLMSSINLKEFNTALGTGLSVYAKQLITLFNLQNQNVIDVLNRTNEFTKQIQFSADNYSHLWNNATKTAFKTLETIKNKFLNQFVNNNQLNEASDFYNNQYTSLQPTDFIDTYLKPTTILIQNAINQINHFIAKIKTDVKVFISTQPSNTNASSGSNVQSGWFYKFNNLFNEVNLGDSNNNFLIQANLLKVYTLYIEQIKPAYTSLTTDLANFEQTNQAEVLAAFYNKVFDYRARLNNFMQTLKASYSEFVNDHSSLNEITHNLYKINPNTNNVENEFSSYINGDNKLVNSYASVYQTMHSKVSALHADNGDWLTANNYDLVEYLFKKDQTDISPSADVLPANNSNPPSSSSASATNVNHTQLFFDWVNDYRQLFLAQIKQTRAVASNNIPAYQDIKPKGDINYKIFENKFANIKQDNTTNPIDITQNTSFLEMFERFAFSKIDQKSMFNPNTLRVFLMPAYAPSAGVNNKTYYSIMDIDPAKPAERKLKFKLRYMYAPNTLINYQQFNGVMYDDVEVEISFQAKNEIAALSGSSSIFADLINNQYQTGYNAKVLVGNSDELNWKASNQNDIINEIISAFKKQVLSESNPVNNQASSNHKIYDYNENNVDTTSANIKFQFNEFFSRTQFSQIVSDNAKQIVRLSTNANNEIVVLVAVPSTLSTGPNENQYLNNKFYKTQGTGNSAPINQDTWMPSTLLINMKFAFEWDQNTHNIYMYNSWYELHNVVKYPKLQKTAGNNPTYSVATDSNTWERWTNIEFARFMLHAPYATQSVSYENDSTLSSGVPKVPSDAASNTMLGAWLQPQGHTNTVNESLTQVNIEQPTLDYPDSYQGKRGSDFVLRVKEEMYTMSRGFYIANPRTGTYYITHGNDINQTQFNNTFKAMNIYNTGITHFKFKIRSKI
ncbi:hypothetical protein OF377_02855 [Ureaplasma sp. ES3154-GEN]|uniref:hypothetical protein n=1 Tax=Ureaplasma sp. ES3154-GEN TaxID=2984844 RepID=UPI0021E8AA42|nr:hypothetical protein [Ureaplasma sp. ES3154-GEN]MCV3743801.1 hypothetical protein [Ureaplasma sp. ES3154-GEN]